MTGQDLKAFDLCCQRQGILFTRYLFSVSIAKQAAEVYELFEGAGSGQYRLADTLRCSTSRFGIGEQAGSNKTPRGLHRITEKFGDGCPVGTVFKARKAVGSLQEMPLATITTRILWLEGLEPGFNRGGDVDSHARYIYIHGTGDESTVGRPASCGCIHLAADDLIPLYEKLPIGTLVWIAEN